MEVLNKISGDFTEDDLQLLTAVSHYVTIAIENSKLYEELKALDKAKGRIINHLSHELKTPIAVISGTSFQLSKELKGGNVEKCNKMIKRVQRNSNRLFNLQVEIDDILDQKFDEM